MVREKYQPILAQKSRQHNIPFDIMEIILADEILMQTNEYMELTTSYNSSDKLKAIDITTKLRNEVLQVQTELEISEQRDQNNQVKD